MNTGRPAAFALAATTLVWGSTFVIVGELVGPAGGQPRFPPFLLLTIRFGLAAALMMAILYVRATRVDAVAWRRGAILGVIVFCGFAFQTVGLQFTTSARSAFLTNVSLLLVPIFGTLLGRGRPGPATILGLLVAFAGLAAIEFPWDLPPRLPENGAAPMPTSDRLLRGDLLTLGCAVFFAFQILATESFARATPLVPFVFVQFLVCAAISGVMSLATGELEKAIPMPGTPAAVGGQIVFLGAIATGVSLLVQAWAQRTVSATRAAIIFTLEPVFATLLAYLVRNELLTAAQMVGAALVLVGILATELLSGSSGDAPETASDGWG